MSAAQPGEPLRPVSPPMKGVLVVGNRAKQAVHAALEKIVPWLERRARVRVDLDIEDPTGPGEADFALVLGGDGSVLRAARRLAPHGVPLLGLNVGKFGFLTETGADDYEAVLSDVLEGRYALAERMMLDCSLERDGRELMRTAGLNDAVVGRSSLSRIITLELHVGDEWVTTYRADGLIVATPVGSTAHSLAAGGPILCPELEALVIAPICPHTLSNRPLVLPGHLSVTVKPSEWAEPPAVTVDGQVMHQLQEGDLVRVRRASKHLLLVRTGRSGFFDTLRNKLDWRGQLRNVT